MKCKNIKQQHCVRCTCYIPYSILWWIHVYIHCSDGGWLSSVYAAALRLFTLYVYQNHSPKSEQRQKPEGRSEDRKTTPTSPKMYKLEVDGGKRTMLYVATATTPKRKIRRASINLIRRNENCHIHINLKRWLNHEPIKVYTDIYYVPKKQHRQQHRKKEKRTIERHIARITFCYFDYCT